MIKSLMNSKSMDSGYSGISCGEVRGENCPVRDNAEVYIGDFLPADFLQKCNRDFEDITTGGVCPFYDITEGADKQRGRDYDCVTELLSGAKRELKGALRYMEKTSDTGFVREAVIRSVGKIGGAARYLKEVKKEFPWSHTISKHD